MKPKIAVCKKFFPLKTANVAYFQRIITLSGISACPDGPPSQLIRIIGVLLYIDFVTSFVVGLVNVTATGTRS
jgi:hypothetical protein